ncbi:hypothetical protein KAM472_39540 [Aeromonas caviae]|nr:hypothetical protein KAM462_30510 [Aeromonas caviae]GKR12521.1 hypothetical protein KAM465_40980 [Aeromonas caviae]GKR16797.1 hypothetical protein KAM466_41150 [Aeromonas caviae]GKR20377.1 hypothetical protein KAM467_34210 [Aeromonas caviae]GKR24720.1 hypothetical protein KAM468_34600 [Aeromonas caviae]
MWKEGLSNRRWHAVKQSACGFPHYLTMVKHTPTKLGFALLVLVGFGWAQLKRDMRDL